MRHDSPKTPPGSPPHQLPPPPPPVGPYETSRSSGASRSSQVPHPPPPPPSTNQEGQSHGITAPSSSKTTASAEYMAWTTSDIRFKPSVNLMQNWWKPLFEEDKPATPEPAWSISSSNLPVPMNNVASALVSTYHLHRRTHYLFRPVTWQYLWTGTYQMEECHKLLIDKVDDALIRPALSISKIKAAYYPDVGFEQMVLDQMWIEEECKHDIAAIYGISYWWYDYLKKIVLRRADLKENIIAERDFKYVYPSDFEDLYLLNLQGHLNHLPPKDKMTLTTAVNLWTRNLVIRQRVEDFQLGIESYQT
nr:hypothetical protein [Tanacetum cinerariifolium]